METYTGKVGEFCRSGKVIGSSHLNSKISKESPCHRRVKRLGLDIWVFSDLWIAANCTCRI